MLIMEALPGKVTLNLNDEKDTYMQGPKEIVAQKEEQQCKNLEAKKVLKSTLLV